MNTSDLDKINGYFEKYFNTLEEIKSILEHIKEISDSLYEGSFDCDKDRRSRNILSNFDTQLLESKGLIKDFKTEISKIKDVDNFLAIHGPELNFKLDEEATKQKMLEHINKQINILNDEANRIEEGWKDYKLDYDIQYKALAEQKTSCTVSGGSKRKTKTIKRKSNKSIKRKSNKSSKSRKRSSTKSRKYRK